MSSAFLIKLRVMYYRVAALLRRWSFIDLFLQKNTFSLLILFKTASFRYIFQKESLMSSFYSKVAV